MARILDALYGQPWAITQEWLSTIVAIASRELSDLEAVRTRAGEPAGETRGTAIRDDAAIIPITGPIFRRANLFARISGATSIELLARDFQAALDNPAVRRIVLEIDSPGGEVSGINEFAELVYSARATKPITAYIGNLGASAAYWIAAAASEIVIDATAIVGSVGVVAAMPTDRPDGELEFTSSQSPNKRPDVQTSAGRSQVQSLIDATADVFIDAVAQYRGVSRRTVMTDFGGGGMLVGAAAVKAGMADRIGSLEGVLGRPAAQDIAVLSRRAKEASLVLPAPGAPPPAASQREGRPLAVLPVSVEEIFMSDETQAVATPAPAAAPPAPPAMPAPPQLNLSDPAVRAQFEAYTAELQTSYRQQYELAMQAAAETARAEFERFRAAEQQRHALLSFAQHVTTPTIARPTTIAYTADQVVDLLATPTAEKMQKLMTDALDGALLVAGGVAGSSRGGESDQGGEWDALVLAYQQQGMAATDAIKAAARKRPDLYQAQSRPKGGR